MEGQCENNTVSNNIEEQLTIDKAFSFFRSLIHVFFVGKTNSIEDRGATSAKDEDPVPDEDLDSHADLDVFGIVTDTLEKLREEVLASQEGSSLS
ncbi:hypothetical protein HNY73_015384 [Argiope bruennichi]|uniref:Uncharacterized protein n=1 Tax=Argiope bruennichi TaxID=94029 RepID=A0A8T0ETV0_ARGBR|nr:hypothetical protein HNY73_015384 [Argiope bruennichi]